MVPLRFASNALDIDNSGIAYDSELKSVSILLEYDGKNGKIATFQAGNNAMYIIYSENNELIKINEIHMANGVYPEIVNGRMYVPFRALGEAMNIKVSWNANNRTAYYSK